MNNFNPHLALKHQYDTANAMRKIMRKAIALIEDDRPNAAGRLLSGNLYVRPPETSDIAGEKGLFECADCGEQSTNTKESCYCAVPKWKAATSVSAQENEHGDIPTV